MTRDLTASKILLTAFLLLWLSGCQARVPMWKPEACAALDKLRKSGAEVLMPADFGSIEESYALGNRFVQNGDRANAEKQYLLTLRNAESLEKRLAEEQNRLEEIRRLRENLDNIERERQKAPEEKTGDQEEKGESPDKTKKGKERVLASTHTVKRGETLPYIASLPDVYNDPGQWPLLYRANRDQIRDPNYIWPGQVLRIPRNMKREDTTDDGKPAQD